MRPVPSASLAGPESAPKDMPAIVMGISKCIGFAAFNPPMVTLVSHFSRYPSKGYREIEAPKKQKIVECRQFALCATTANVIYACSCSATNFTVDILSECCGLPWRGARDTTVIDAHFVIP